MPYVAIKAYPGKDRAKTIELAEEIKKLVMEKYNVPETAVIVSFEEIEKDQWEEKVNKVDIAPKMDTLLIYHGEKKY